MHGGHGQTRMLSKGRFYLGLLRFADETPQVHGFAGLHCRHHMTQNRAVCQGTLSGDFRYVRSLTKRLQRCEDRPAETGTAGLRE